MSLVTKGIFIVAAKRTPFGSFGGKFMNKNATDLSVIAAKSALQSAKLNPEKVDNVIFGHVLPISSSDGGFLTRHVALKSGIPLEKPSFSLNRLCGSGFQSIVSGAQSILLGESKIVLTGGVENMSQVPFSVRNIRFGTSLGQKYQFEDSLWLGFSDTYCNLSMGETAEKLGSQYNLKRQEVDEFALRSQQLWKAANDAGRFNEEIAPVTITVKKQDIVVNTDEHPRPQTTLQNLSKLPSIFKKDGLVTAGSSSGISDGAGVIILASEEVIKTEQLTPLARLVGYSVVGVEPSIMGIGPVPAIQKLLKITNKTLNDIELIEINEAFGSQTLACVKELKLDINKLNVDGGSIALGHPLAASGSRITAHLVHELRRRKTGSLGIGSACIGGGQGIALMIEAL
ncbi:3-ketoacyl-CoA thiolase, mitochondrial [Apis mellifera caucasica]|uniref:3-ketoacyl-CoA thiolase, mitochondrial n=1 Tax=Apis mellifera TaxID=7460 RepID=A0A7M7R2I6_APIME|nr:3-ketoacyl-CoA thiolase, mitochondrial [Apis mellifera]KAG6795973.1 3-ketoacyl-CoA thiolase, mitochondrial [Apis mellifera caucasica]KAG9430444.1 3-ketoacyl-CoA thiolase, mitochondrial [Apis mellifera carnica]|eukprot:XP_391843.1 3-ketoacyl-CoA thiolase, mitochondrial [Apis mellifera]